ncbi:unnamed protein product [Closterium sp. NIES-64]|nr:unnamed protein product [Closterium sp. NIES-64]
MFPPNSNCCGCGSGNCCNIRSTLNSSGSFTFIPTTSFSSGFNGWLGNKASSPVGSRSPVLGLSPQLAAARLCHLMMLVVVGGGSPVPYSPRPFGVASAALVSQVLSAPVALVAAMCAVGSPAHACSTVVDSGQESADVASPPREWWHRRLSLPSFWRLRLTWRLFLLLAQRPLLRLTFRCCHHLRRRLLMLQLWRLRLAVSLPAPPPPGQFGGAGLPPLRLPSLVEELLPPRAETLAHGLLPPVPAESLLDDPRDDCLDAAAPVWGSVGAVGQLDSAVRDLQQYLRAGTGADAIGSTILAVAAGKAAGVVKKMVVETLKACYCPVLTLLFFSPSFSLPTLAVEAGAPMGVVEKMVVGWLGKLYEEVVLLKLPHSMDEKRTVQVGVRWCTRVFSFGRKEVVVLL